MSMELPSAWSGSKFLAWAGVVSTRTVCAEAISPSRQETASSRTRKLRQTLLFRDANFALFISNRPPGEKDLASNEIRILVKVRGLYRFNAKETQSLLEDYSASLLFPTRPGSDASARSNCPADANMLGLPLHELPG